MWRAHAEAPAAASAKPAPEGTEAPTQKKRTTGCSLCDQFLDTPCENLMFAFKTASLAREARLWPLDSSSTGDSVRRARVFLLQGCPLGTRDMLTRVSFRNF
jgi:hypothetical protein